MPGQMALFAARRCLGHAELSRIAARSWPEENDLARVIDTIAHDRGLSIPWRQQVKGRVRLALALRDAEGARHIDDALLSQLHYGINTGAREALRLAGLLGPLARPRQPAPKVHACHHCGSWGLQNNRVCKHCRDWALNPARYPKGCCRRCGRHLALQQDERMCRGCLAHVRENGPAAAAEPFTQLTFAAPLAHQLARTAGELGFVPHNSSGPAMRNAARRKQEALAAPWEACSVDPNQQFLFDMDRDWHRVAALDLLLLPAPTKRATSLLDGFRAEHTDSETGLMSESARSTVTGLGVLLRWLGAEAPVRESDIRAMAAVRPGRYSVDKMTGFLAARNLLARDLDPEPATVRLPIVRPLVAAPTARHRTAAARETALEATVRAMISRLPEPMATELGAWVRVMRGSGRYRHPAVGWRRIRLNLYIVSPTLKTWSAAASSLREITREQVTAELDRHQGNKARGIFHVLLSIFRALKQERIIFRNPMTGLSLSTPARPPISLPSDLLRGLLNRIPTVIGRLSVALVAIHAVKGEELRRLLLTDHLPQHGALIIRRGERTHTVYLDRLTHNLLTDWLTERTRRWPASPNPHLLITAHSAHHPETPPLSYCALRAPFDQAGISMGRLWRDRVLNEARTSADPVHLVHLFGIHPGTAVRYVHAAHPDRALPPIR
ncbi:hypothetical protein ACWGH5_39280 [Streptomyces sp. NPDC054864]